MEQCLYQLPNEMQRHYYQGCAYLYKSFAQINGPPCDKDELFLKLAQASFQVALADLPDNQTTVLSINARAMYSILAKKDLDEDEIQDLFIALTNMTYNAEASNTLFRIVLIFLIWNNLYPNSTATNFATAASKVYNKTTMYRGYRSTLLTGCLRYFEYGIFGHTEMDTDYPPIECMSPARDLDESVHVYWQAEFKEKIPKNKPSRVLAQTILSHSNECRELFGFGYHIIKDLIRPL